MKKGLLVCLSLAIGIGAMGQRASRLPQGFRKAEVPASLKYQTVKVTPTKGLDNGVPVNNLQSRQHVPAPATSSTYVNEDVVGYTYYDLQTNGAVSNRLQKNDDGTFSAIWTFSPDASTGFPNRGTGYNYFDGIAWGALPNARIEPVRTGFTTLGVTQSGAEMTIQHTGTSMSLNRRAAKGTGAWTTSYPWGQTNNDFWPKSVIGGDHVYVLFQGTGSTGVNLLGQDGPIFFSKSDDAGQTWTTKSVIDLIDSTYYIGFGGDDYTLDADVSGNVAIVYGSTVTDIGLLKSTDFGVTWTKTIVQTFPIPLYDLNAGPTDVNGDGTPDTLNTNAGDAHVMLDNGGRAHIWFTDYRFYSDFSTPGSYSYFPSTDGLFYWNETMPTDGYVFIASAQDYNIPSMARV